MNTTGRINISRELLNKLSIPVQPYINVRAGNIVVTARLVIENQNKRTSYMLSPALSKALYLKRRKPLQLRYDREENMIHIGPTIGILAASLPNRAEFDPKSMQAELIYLSNVSRKMNAQIFIFTPGSIDWSNNTVKGYVYRQLSPGKGVWVSSLYPLPEVVYDRISTRKSEIKVKETKTRLCNLPYIKYFNPCFLNKWKVHQMLITNPDLHSYLPQTMQLNEDNLAEMLQKYRVVYLKPSNGSLGKGIIKVRRDANNIFQYVVYRKGRIRSQAESVAELMRKTKQYRSDKPYIVQQGLDLAAYKGSIFDLRIIFQKNRHGEWQISKKFVRVAPKGSSISNLSSGGRAETSKRVFRYLYQKKSLIEYKNQEIKKLCKCIADTLENVSQEIYGELGLDIGIDKTGRIWLIEVNSKPRKTTETELSMTIVNNTFKRPLEYGMYLAGF